MYWPFIDYIAGLFYKDSKITRNIVSCSHAVSSCILYAVNQDQMRLNSLTYFVWDTVYILEQQKTDWLLLWHHLVTNYLLVIEAPKYVKEHVLFVLELSNLPTYLVYHMLKLERDVRLARIFQFVWMFYFRVYVMTDVVLNILHAPDIDMIPTFLICLIHIIGINLNVSILKQIVCSKTKNSGSL